MGSGAPNTAEIIGGRYFSNSEVALRSFAVGGYFAVGAGACTGTMIGPRIGMTAAHCSGGVGGLSAVTFQMYRDGNKAGRLSETANCRLLQNALDCNAAIGCVPGAWWGDALLFECGALADGRFPGDKYGYVDLDNAEPPTPSGESGPVTLYSLWQNPILNIPDAASGAILFSEGWVRAKNGNAWCNDYSWDSCTGAGDFWQAYDLRMWGAAGGSGALHFAYSNHRAVIGPLSQAPSPADGGTARRALSIREVLRWVKSDVSKSQVNTSYLDATYPTLAPSSAYGNVVWDSDTTSTMAGYNVPELQQAIERNYHKETQRDHYNLNFNNHRRNALWDVLDPTTAWFEPYSNLLRINENVSVPWIEATHARLNLKPNTSYRVSFLSYTYSVGGTNALRMEMNGSLVGNVDTTVLNAWRRNTFRFTTGASAPFSLSFKAYLFVNSAISQLDVIEEGAVANFDSGDKRPGWRNVDSGLVAHIIPTDSPSGVSLNWAGAARRKCSGAASSWMLANSSLALVPGRNYNICFKTKKLAGTKRLEVRAELDNSISGLRGVKVVESTSSWSGPHCLAFNGSTRLSVPVGSAAFANNTLRFSISEFIPSDACDSTGAYYIDDITIVDVP